MSSSAANTVSQPTILLIAGFGDNASMYAPLLKTQLSCDAELVPLDLPGFGAPPLTQETTLQALGDWVAGEAIKRDASLIVAHSVASIIASFAAQASGSPLVQIVSLEGNLTSEDAYFSGRASEFADAASFRNWFLPRLESKAGNDPILERYLREVERADPEALWQLGCDAHRFSRAKHVGAFLAQSGRVTYVVNRGNCAEGSMQWLDQSGFAIAELPGASHWPTIDQPERLAEVIRQTLGQ